MELQQHGTEQLSKRPSFDISSMQTMLRHLNRSTSRHVEGLTMCVAATMMPSTACPTMSSPPAVPGASLSAWNRARRAECTATTVASALHQTVHQIHHKKQIRYLCQVNN